MLDKLAIAATEVGDYNWGDDNLGPCVIDRTYDIEILQFVDPIYGGTLSIAQTESSKEYRRLYLLRYGYPDHWLPMLHELATSYSGRIFVEGTLSRYVKSESLLTFCLYQAGAPSVEIRVARVDGISKLLSIVGGPA